LCSALQFATTTFGGLQVPFSGGRIDGGSVFGQYRAMTLTFPPHCSALDALQQEIALRWKNQGVKVVTLNPGRVLTHGEPASPGQSTVKVEDSIRGMIAVLDQLTKEQSGQTISWDGERLE
jgi:NAD(P)-dependent dehydrogenase (short-subunit alcohol dehydrogenase family)